MEQMITYMRGLDWSPLIISLKTGVVATVFSFFLGIFAARKVVKAGPKTKAIADGILTLPMVLPPTVAGFFLLLIFSLRRPFGSYLYQNMGIKVVQTWLGCIWKVVIPAAGPGILSGTILTFARALGEYGATSMLAGNIPGKTSTISQKIAMVIQDGDYATAGFWVVIILLIAFLVVFLMNLIAGKSTNAKRRW